VKTEIGAHHIDLLFVYLPNAHSVSAEAAEAVKVLAPLSHDMSLAGWFTYAFYAAGGHGVNAFYHAKYAWCFKVVHLLLYAMVRNPLLFL
jgi:hypothetical protein